jgi:hypothetical protein
MQRTLECIIFLPRTFGDDLRVGRLMPNTTLRGDKAQSDSVSFIFVLSHRILVRRPDGLYLYKN